MLSYLHSVSCDLQGLLGDALLKERLDMDTLEMVGLVSSKTNFNQRYVKTKTKLLYVSSKYWGIIIYSTQYNSCGRVQLDEQYLNVNSFIHVV